MASLTRLQDERGAALVEFAVALPVLVLITCGIFDFGFLFQKYEVLTNAAREGARFAALPNYDDAMVQAYVQEYLAAGDVTGAVVSLPAREQMTVAGVTFTVVRVGVTYTHHFSFLGPFNGALGSVVLSPEVVMRVETQGS